MGVEFILFLIFSNFLSQEVLKTKESFLFAIIFCQVFGWGVQFIGHGVFEGRRPALMDNLFQIFIAPIFVMLEYSFQLGLFQDLHQEINAKIRERAAHTRQEKKKQ